MVVKYQKLGFLQMKGKKTPWKVPTVYSKIDDRLKKQPMGQEDLLQFQPTVYHREYDKMMELGEKFIKQETSEKPQIFYVWGHSYEFDYYDTWSQFEEFCKMMSGREDICYVTNQEALLGNVGF